MDVWTDLQIYVQTDHDCIVIKNLVIFFTTIYDIPVAVGYPALTNQPEIWYPAKKLSGRYIDFLCHVEIFKKKIFFDDSY